MTALSRWWHWLGQIQIIVRWPARVEREDWCSEQRGALRW